MKTTVHEYRPSKAAELARTAGIGDLIYTGKGAWKGAGIGFAPSVEPSEDTDPRVIRRVRAAMLADRRARERAKRQVDELADLLRRRGLDLAPKGGFYYEVRLIQKPMSATSTPCTYCGGQVWCGACRRCGTKP